tara:strand:- start:888 stop:1472 length:585 start_codon:yes stop_codon:yes gene_type:complete
MVKLTGKKKINCAVFISGRGTNLKSILKYSKKKISKININLVISNNSNAPGIKFAKKNKINNKIIIYKNNNAAEKKILKNLKKYKIKYIFLAGFMKILSKQFIRKFENKIFNIHPSLLPKYKGLNTHERVIKNKEKFSGCTVHFVNNKLDSGKIILQKKVKILNSDTPKKLANRVLKVENKLYPKAINKFFSKI